MGKNKAKQVSPNEQALLEGLEIVKAHSLFSRLSGWERIDGKERMGKETAAYVSSSGNIYLNRDYPMKPGEWAFTIAHCKLHLAFGHFDAEKMPGFNKVLEDGTENWQVSANKDLWNSACDIYVDKFLYDIHFGTPTVSNPTNEFGGGLNDERKIYDLLLNKGYPSDRFMYGTASEYSRDMEGLDKPLIYDKKGWHSHNRYADTFADALSYSVANVVSEAGGHAPINSKKYTKAELASQWFINHYPLLGGLAAHFKIIEDYDYCMKNEISIAAIDVDAGEICVNPAAGLTDENYKFVLAHEYLHAGLQHKERCRGRDPYIWNIACDYVINGWLKDMQIGTMPERGLMYDEKFKDDSAEYIYDEIIMNLKKYSLETFRGYGKGDIMAGGRPHFGNTDSSITVDEFCKNALRNGLEYHTSHGRGYIPWGLVEEIRALSMPPVPWDVELAKWFDAYFAPLEKHRTYARPSRRQGSTPDIPRPSYVSQDIPDNSRTFGVVIDTSGSMSAELIGYALGAVASYSVAKEVPYARVVFCDADAYDAGYLAPEDIAGRVAVKGRGGTILQPGVDLLQEAKDFPKNGPILIITDGEIEDRMDIKREHAFLIPQGRRLPFGARGKVFYFEKK